MAYQFGSFVWHELVVPDIDKAKRFYPKTLGWGTTEMDMGDFKYTMLTEGDSIKGGVVNPQGGPQPPHWASYLSVGDVDAAVERVEKAGGKVLAPAFDLPTVGRMAPVADPQGATLFLFKGETGDDETERMHWNELWAKDADAVLDFYKTVANLTVEERPKPQGKYYILKANDRQVGGVMTSPDPKVPPMWLPYISVEDADATLQRAEKNGGKVIKSADDVPGIGRFGVIADDQRAVVGIIKSAPRS